MTLKKAIRVLVVDDSALMREMICDNLRAAPDMEVAGTAAITVPADDEYAWASAIHLLCDQPAAADALRLRGREQAAKFSWQQSAQSTIQVYNEVALFV